MDAASATVRLEKSMAHFIVRWGRREFDELAPRTAAKLLQAACRDTLPLGAVASAKVDTPATHTDASRERANTHDDTVGGAALGPAKAALKDAIRPCLAGSALTDLSLLYNDLHAPSQDVRYLIDYQPEKLRAIAAGMLDVLEQAAAQALATRVGEVLLNRLFDAAARKPPDPPAVRSALEQLQGIGQWLSSPSRPETEVLNLILDSLTDAALGRLAAQAWPELSARDERYGADPAAMAAAVMFLDACDGAALQLWRDALQTQLRRRKRVVAAQAAETLWRGSGWGGPRESMRAAKTLLEQTAQKLTGRLPIVSVLHARIRDEALALALQHVPTALRIAGLRTLQPRDLSALRYSLDTSVDMTHLKTTVGSNVDTVRDDILKAAGRAVEDALASLHDVMAAGDRAAASIQFGALAHAVRQLEETRQAFDAPMPPMLVQSLEHTVRRMHALLHGDPHGSDRAGVLHALCDIELGQLRTAIGPLARFGTLVDKRDLGAEIKARAVLPPGADDAMDRLMDTCASADATIFDILGRLRDIAEILIRHNERLSDLGEEISADSNEQLAYEAVSAALDRYKQRDANGQARLRQAMARHPEITGATLHEVLAILADVSAAQAHEESARLSRHLAMLGLAGRVEAHLHGACMGDEDASADAAHPANAAYGAAGADAAEGVGGVDAAETPDALGAPDAAGEPDAACAPDAAKAPDAAGAPDAADAHPGPPGVGGDIRAGQALRLAIASEFGVDWDQARQTARPCMTRDHHLLFRQYLAAPPSADAATARPVSLPVEGGEASWFSVSEAYARDVLWQPGISLAVEGISARGHPVHYAGFDPTLQGDARLAAAGAAMRALRALAGDSVLALTRLIHRGALDAFVTALAKMPENSPLQLPDGTRVQIPHATPDVAEFRVKREADGRYLVETTLVYSALDMAISRVPPGGGYVTIRLDSARSRATATFALATDARGENPCLWSAEELRYRLVPREGGTDE
jgi:hypothetical protein